MESLASLFKKLKTQVGGNRERTGYEFTSGATPEEFAYVTMPSAWQRRILGQLEYALALEALAEGKHGTALRDALVYLLRQMEAEGALTTQSAQKAEAMLAPYAADAKSYSLILCSHAHIDMNWMWSWPETVAATLDTFRTMLQLMREYPQFTYSQSQASVYKIVEQYAPEMMAEIKERIAEGRWEVTAAAWVETDKNMPSTESLSRHMLYTKAYMHEVWGVPLDRMKVDYSPDTFGHSTHLPTLNNAGDVPYYYHCRGREIDSPLHRWKAPSGKEVIIYQEPYWYNSTITTEIAPGLPELAARSGGLRTGLIVYGVGDHGGGPSRRDIERAIDMQSWPIYPEIRFGTYHEFFALAETVREKLPLIDTEINAIFTGCYTTQSRIKQGNRQSEAALYRAEALSALSSGLLGEAYDTKGFERAWQNTLFTHFHDIITGSCTPASREYAMGLYGDALSVAQTQHAKAIRAIAQQVDTSALKRDECIADTLSEGGGAGYGVMWHVAPAAERGAGKRRLFHVQNLLPQARRTLVEITVWDWLYDVSQIAFTDAAGNALAHQMLDEKPQHYWGHSYFRVLVDVSLPAMGYTTLVMDETERTSYPARLNPLKRDRRHFPNEDIVLENEHLRATICFRTGAILSLFDKATKTETLSPDRPASMRVVHTECDVHYNAWVIGRYMQEETIDKDVSVATTHTGTLRQSVTIKAPYQGSQLEAQISLDAHSHALEINLRCDWRECTRMGDVFPTLVFSAGVMQPCGDYLYDVPAGCQLRKAQHLDLPAQSFIAAPQKGTSLVLASDCKYGFRGSTDGISVTLIHPANYPDEYPEVGIHNIKLFLGAIKGEAAQLRAEVCALLMPPSGTSTGAHEGSWPTTASLLEIDGKSSALSAVKLAEDGSGVIVRLFEMEGKKDSVRIAAHKPIVSAVAINTLEATTEGDVSTDKGAAVVKLAPNAMASVKLTF